MAYIVTGSYTYAATIMENGQCREETRTGWVSEILRGFDSEDGARQRAEEIFARYAARGQIVENRRVVAA